MMIFLFSTFMIEVKKVKNLLLKNLDFTLFQLVSPNGIILINF